MPRKAVDNVKLGVFVLAGLAFLVILLYMIGKNQNLFGSTYELRVRFQNVQGLMAGNNVRFAGIEVGTVKEITILNDTAIEVRMMIEERMQPVIRKNAVAFIGTEGLVGNKVVNIVAASEPGELAEEGDLLVTRKEVNPDEILETLHRTNNDVAVIASELKKTIQNINNSTAFWTLLDDKTIPLNIKSAMVNVRRATEKARVVTDDLHAIVLDVQQGKGSIGQLLNDTSFAAGLNDFAAGLNEAVLKLNEIENKADALMDDFNEVFTVIENDISEGPGPANALLKDSTWVTKMNASLSNIQEGTERFNENMEALKHNFLFRGYFRRQEKQRQKELEQARRENN